MRTSDRCLSTYPEQKTRRFEAAGTRFECKYNARFYTRQKKHKTPATSTSRAQNTHEKLALALRYLYSHEATLHPTALFSSNSSNNSSSFCFAGIPTQPFGITTYVHTVRVEKSNNSRPFPPLLSYHVHPTRAGRARDGRTGWGATGEGKGRQTSSGSAEKRKNPRHSLLESG